MSQIGDREDQTENGGGVWVTFIAVAVVAGGLTFFVAQLFTPFFIASLASAVVGASAGIIAIRVLVLRWFVASIVQTALRYITIPGSGGG